MGAGDYEHVIVFIQNLGPVKRVEARTWRLDKRLLFVFARFEDQLISEFKNYRIYYVHFCSITRIFAKNIKQINRN